MQLAARTVLLGIITGSVYALAATGLVLTYRVSGVLNFGYGGLAMFAGYLYWQLAVRWGWPAWLAAAAVVLVAMPAAGWVLDAQLFRRLQGQPMVLSVIATVGLTVLLQGLVLTVWGAESRSVPSVFPSRSIRLLGGVRVGVSDLAVLGVAGGAAGLLALLLRRTRMGVRLRAVVDNRAVAGLMGVNTRRVSATAWALGTSFAGLTGVLLTPSLLLDPNFLPVFVVAQVLGAAVVGHLRSLPLAYLGGLILGMAQALAIEYVRLGGVLRNVRDAIPFLVVAGAVLSAPAVLRAAGEGTSFMVRVRETTERAPPQARAGVAAAVALALVILPALAPLSWELAVRRGLVMALLALSIVVLTGFSGQVSLGHTGFMGIAAYTAAHLARDLGVPMWAAMVCGVAATLPAGAAIGVAAVRLHGLYLALMTLAFGFVAHAMFFNDNAISGGFSGFPLPRPPGARSEQAFYYLTLVSFGLAAALALNLRTGRTGRVLAGMRDSETAARALGINVVRYKVVVFSLSAALAGWAAILGGMQVEHLSPRDFFPFLSLVYVTIAVIGGIFHVGGALTAGLLFGLYPLAADRAEILARLQYVLFGLGATIALAQNPEGLFGELRRAALRAGRRALGHREVATVAGGER